MEKIDLNNYEAYFLDFMEGSLSAEEKHDLFTFLEKHPELKNEFELDFGEMALFPVTITFENKAELKIDEADLIITPNTLPDLMVASIEKQLSSKHQQQLISYIDKHELSAVHATYKNTILKPDLAVVFDEKERLKQKGGILISKATFRRAAAIAAVGLVLVTLAVNWGVSPGANTIDPQSKFVNDQVKTRFLNGFISDHTERNKADFSTDVEPNQEPKSPAPKEIDELIQFMNNEDIVEQRDEISNDSIPALKNNPTPLDDLEQPKDYELVKDEDKDPVEKGIPMLHTEDIYASIRKEEPYKIVTEAASNLVNKEVEFTRDRNINTNNYVAYSFKLGNFGFEHKKSSK